LGEGLATEAACTALDYAFGTLGLDTVAAGHHPSNLAPHQVLAKIGFKYTLEEFYEPSGIFESTYVCAGLSGARGNNEAPKFERFTPAFLQPEANSLYPENTDPCILTKQHAAKRSPASSWRWCSTAFS
jgi:hypothetical protein